MARVSATTGGVRANLRRSGSPLVGPGTAFLILLTIALAYWGWFGLAVRNINHDDGISILAAQGVLEHGFQRLPSGFTYPRGYLSHYVVAASVGVFGLNDFAIMLPSLLFGLGSLILVYRIARDILGRPWLGVGTVGLLITLTLQTWYATGPRMYMPVQFWTMLAMYSAWRGYMQGERRLRVVTVVALVVGMLSAEQGLIVAVAVPAAILIVLRLRGEAWSKIFSPWNLATAILLGLIAVAVATYDPPRVMPLVIGHGGVDPDRVGVSLNPINWGRHVLHLERTIPYSLAFLLVACLAFVKSLRWRLDPGHRWTYLALVFGCGFLIMVLGVRTGSNRLHLFLVPIYALFVCAGAAALARLLTPAGETSLRAGRGGRLAAVALATTGIAMSLGLSTLKELSFRDVREGRESVGQFMLASFRRGLSIGGLVRNGYGRPCLRARECDPGLRAQYDSLGRTMGPDDLVVALRPMEVNYFLGRVDGWMHIGREDQRYPTLDRSPTDEYFGVPIIDTTEELRELSASDRRVWIIVGVDRSTSAMWMTLEQEFTRYHTASHFVVFVNDRPAVEALTVRVPRHGP